MPSSLSADANSFTHEPAFMAKVALEAHGHPGAPDEIAARHGLPVHLVAAWRQRLEDQAARLFGAVDKAAGEPATALPPARPDPRIAALEQMDVSIAILEGDELRYTYANGAYRAGAQMGEVVGKRMRDVFPGSLSDGVEAGVRQVLLTGQPWDVRNFHAHLPGLGESVWEGRISRMQPAGDAPASVVIWIRDVTAAARLEALLRQQVALLRAISENANDVMFAKDRDGRMQFANPAALGLIGKPASEVIGKTDAEFLQDAEAARLLMENDRRIMESGAAEELEETVPLADGTPRIWLSQKRAYRDEQGAVAGLLGVSRDITDRKHGEDSVRAAHAALQRVLDSISDGLAVLDRDWHYTYFSETGARMLGVRSEDLLGKQFWELFPHAEHLLFGREYRRAVETGVATHFEEFYPEPLNKWLECHCYPSPDGLSVYFRDVTDQRRVQDAAAENERRIQALLEATPVGLAYADANGRMLVMNTEGRRIWGSPPLADCVASYAEWKGWWTRESGKSGQRIAAEEWPMARALRGEQVFDMVAEIEPFDAPGTRRIILLRSVTIRDDSGRITGAVTAQTDITEAEQTKAAVSASQQRIRELTTESERILALSEERFRTLIMATAQIVWHCEPDGSVHEDSPSWRAYTGQTLEEWQGYGWLNALHPSERESTARKLQECIDSKQVYTNEQRLRRADGQYRWHAVRAVPIFTPDGAIREWVGANTDIQPRKEAEIDRQRFVSLAERSTDFIGMCDLAFRPFFLNRAAIETIGGGDGTWPCARVDDVFFPEDLPFIRSEFLPRVTRDGHAEAELRMRHLVTGEPIWMIFSVYTLTDLDGKPEGYATVSRNISERKAAEETLRRLAADLSDANKRKSEFLATLAHELRNPLAPIRTGLDLMRLAGTNMASVGRAREMMDRQLRQMVHLIDDLMDIARINNGKIELKRVRVDLHSVVTNAVESVLPMLESARHALEVDMPGMPVWLDADPTRLAQVFGNLLTNAAKYTPNGGRIRLSAQLESDDWLAVVVADNGIGIPPEALAGMFEMFNQVSQNLGRAQGGLGIGLALVRSLVQMHGGTVAAASAGPGQGSSFTVRLPVLALGTQEALAADAPEASIGGKVKARVLVADDNVDAAAMLSSLLETAGHTVTVAHDGNEALRAATEGDFDLLILDIGMPGVTGYELAARIRTMPHLRHAILAAHTGWGAENDRARALDAGFDIHLTKPVGLPELSQVLARLEHRRAMRDDGAP